MKNPLLLVLLLLGTVSLRVAAQSPAAIAKVAEIYTADQVADMKTHDPGKYNSLVWYMAKSFQVVEGTSRRDATEAEISALNIKAYDNDRKVDEEVIVNDPSTGLTLALKGAEQCWTDLESVLDPVQWKKLHDIYLRNKALRENNELPKAQKH